MEIYNELLDLEALAEKATDLAVESLNLRAITLAVARERRIKRVCRDALELTFK